MKPKTISDATRVAILDAAWELIAEEGRLDIAQQDIARRAGVSRQTVFYAFGDRAGLLVAMVRHKDTKSDHVDRIMAAMAAPDDGVAGMLRVVGAWLDYLPEIYPVGILLDAASLADPAAQAAWSDRMDAVHVAIRRTVEGLSGDPDRVADEIWALCHPTQWRRLVLERGWSAEAFRDSRFRLARSVLESA